MFCRIYRSAIEEDLDDFGSVQRSYVANHLQKCSHCRAFYHKMTQLEHQLRSTPSRELSDEQVERIRLAVQRRLSETAPTYPTLPAFQRPAYSRIRYAIFAATAVLLVSLMGLYYFQRARPAQPVDPMAQFVINSTAFQDRLSLLARLPEQSIQTEMQKLANDAHSAIAFIVNCVPAAPADINPSQQRNQSTP